MSERLAPAAVVADFVAGPSGPELLAARGQLADEGHQIAVVGSSGRLGTEASDGVESDAVPVGVELDRVAVEEHEPGEVDRPGRVEERGCVQRVAELVGGEDVESCVADERGDADHRVKQSLHAGADLIAARRTSTAAAAARARSANEVKQVRSFDVVELQCPGQPLEDVVGDAADAATLDARVVLDRDTGEECDLLSPQAWYAAPAAVVRQSRLLRRDPRTAGGQELAELPACVLSGLHLSRLGIDGDRRQARPVPL